jgi:epoxide hydrolase 4
MNPAGAPVVETLTLPHGITLRLRRQGQGPSRVLLLHGFPEAACVWDPVMAALAPRAQCVAPDLRGYPGSSAPAAVEAYRTRHLVADLVALIEALGAPLDLLVAHDWGGAVAWALAAQRPGLLRRLLIVNAPHPATFLRELRHNPAQQAASAYMNYLCRPDAEQRLAEDGHARLLAFFGDAAWLDEARRAAFLTQWRQGLTGPLNYYRASPLRPASDAASPLHRIELPDAAVTVNVPTTVLWGERDIALLPALLDGLERWVPALQIERVPEASHWIVHEQPQRVATVAAALLPD